MYYVFLALLPVALGQIKADVHFGEENDRYDLTPLIEQGAYEQWDNVVGIRRDNRIINPEVESNSPTADVTKRFMNALRRFREDYSRSQNLMWKEDTARKSYDKSDEEHAMSTDQKRDLVEYLREGLVNRRSSGARDDRAFLMHYGVPIVMKVEGIMQVPLDRE